MNRIRVAINSAVKAGLLPAGRSLRESQQNLRRKKSQMNAMKIACASSANASPWSQLDWGNCERQVNRLQARIVKATHRRCSAVLRNGLSRMSGNVPVRFLGEDAPVTTHPYPTQPTPIEKKTGARSQRSPITRVEKREQENFPQECLCLLTCLANGCLSPMYLNATRKWPKRSRQAWFKSEVHLTNFS
jgi:hypothetical protein